MYIFENAVNYSLQRSQLSTSSSPNTVLMRTMCKVNPSEKTNINDRHLEMSNSTINHVLVFQNSWLSTFSCESDVFVFAVINFEWSKRITITRNRLYISLTYYMLQSHDKKNNTSEKKGKLRLYTFYTI